MAKFGGSGFRFHKKPTNHEQTCDICRWRSLDFPIGTNNPTTGKKSKIEKDEWVVMHMGSTYHKECFLDELDRIFREEGENLIDEVSSIIARRVLRRLQE